VAITGLEQVSIGDTVSSPDEPVALPRIDVGEPTVKMTFGVNTSPFAGREGRFCTSRQLRDRLYRELQTNLSLRVEDTDSADSFLVVGRGELHLAVLIESMRREGYEFQVSKPEAVVKIVDGKTMEPVESLTIDARQEYVGALTESLSKRLATLTYMRNDDKGNIRIEFRIPTRGLIGFPSSFLTLTRGEGVMNSTFLGYEPWCGEMSSTRSGVLLASEDGVAVTYGLNNAQARGVTFVEPGTPVYEGMIVGQHSRSNDIPMNIAKEKKQTNIRSSTADIAIKLTPAVKFSLERSLDFIGGDELVEVTPKSIRMRKKMLTQHDRLRARGDSGH